MFFIQFISLIVKSIMPFLLCKIKPQLKKYLTMLILNFALESLCLVIEKDPSDSVNPVIKSGFNFKIGLNLSLSKLSLQNFSFLYFKISCFIVFKNLNNIWK